MFSVRRDSTFALFHWHPLCLSVLRTVPPQFLWISRRENNAVRCPTVKPGVFCPSHRLTTDWELPLSEAERGRGTTSDSVTAPESRPGVDVRMVNADLQSFMGSRCWCHHTCQACINYPGESDRSTSDWHDNRLTGLQRMTNAWHYWSCNSQVIKQTIWFLCCE